MKDNLLPSPTQFVRDDFYYKDLYFEHYVCDLPRQGMSKEETEKYLAENLEKIYKFAKCNIPHK